MLDLRSTTRCATTLLWKISHWKIKRISQNCSSSIFLLYQSYYFLVIFKFPITIYLFQRRIANFLSNKNVPSSFCFTLFVKFMVRSFALLSTSVRSSLLDFTCASRKGFLKLNSAVNRLERDKFYGLEDRQQCQAMRILATTICRATISSFTKRSFVYFPSWRYKKRVHELSVTV